jgi:lipopolysaccharide export LptBFGC system permease protein LptF
MYSSMVTPPRHSCYCADHRFVLIRNVCVTGVPASLLTTATSGIPVPPAEMNTRELYQQATGFLPRGRADEKCKQKEEGAGYSIIPVDFRQPETLIM